jgi:hypothetical protein
VARFTHLARAKDEASIRHGGVKPTRVTNGLSGVYAMAVLPSYFASHQWLRELVGSVPRRLSRSTL